MSGISETNISEFAELMAEATSNVEKVFYAGVANGYSSGYGEGYNNGHAIGLDEGNSIGYNLGLDNGRKAERDAFWDAFQGAARRTWSAAFQNKCWNDNTFYPKYDLVVSGNCASLFRYCGITDLEKRLSDCGVILDTSGATNLNCAFGETTLTVIPTVDISKCTAAGSTGGLFSGCYGLKTIRKIILNETSILADNAFQNTPELENVVFEGVIANNLKFPSSTKLTKDSIASIINALSSTAYGKTLTLSETAVNEAFRGYGAIPDYPTKGEVYWGTDLDGKYSLEWDDLVYSKPNWTIALV